jgi:hypothetical protein
MLRGKPLLVALLCIGAAIFPLLVFKILQSSNLGAQTTATVLLWACFASLFAVAITLPFALLDWFGDFVVNFISGGGRFHKPPPAYSLPEALESEGKYEQAIEAYAKLADEHPGEILPHMRTMKIWITKLQNPQAAADAYTNAMTKIRGAQNRKKFDRMARNDYSKHILFG